MKNKFHLSLLAGLLLAGIHLEAVAQAGDTLQNPATTPSDANFKAHTRWNIRCAERVGAMIGKPCDLLFIGDSITQNFSDDANGDWNVGDDLVLHYLADERPFELTGRAVWNTYFRHRNALNFGVAADGTEHMLWRMDHMDIRQFRPKLVIILAGTNDISKKPEQIASGVRALLTKTQLLFPDAYILLTSLTPRRNQVQNIIAVNQLIRAYVDNQKIFYLDLFTQMAPQEDGWLGIGHDQLHLNSQGYALWAKAILPWADKFAPVMK